MELNKKITILRLIYDYKDVLLGKFNSGLTHQTKVDKWKKIAAKGKELGIYKNDWKYLRDTTWQNWKKRTIEKRDKLRRTGCERKKLKYNDADELILKIIGQDSQATEGLPMCMSSRLLVRTSAELPIRVPSDLPIRARTNLSIRALSNLPIRAPSDPPICTPSDLRIRVPSHLPVRISSSSNTPQGVSIQMHEETPLLRPRPRHQPTRRPPRVISDRSMETKISKELLIIENKKMDIELDLAKERLEIAKRERYKFDLEILRLERELNIQPPSDYTLPLYQQNAENVENINYDINYDELRFVDRSPEN